MRTVTRVPRRPEAAWSILVLGIVLLGAPAVPRPVAAAETASTPTLKELGHEFEMREGLPAAERPAAVERVGGAVEALLQHGVDSGQRAAAWALAGAARDELGDRPAAARAYGNALAAAGDGPLADDAAFAAIEVLESAGRDGEAAREWARWTKRYPASPLLAEARLRMAWNALRRDTLAEAGQLLAALQAGAPWMKGDPRVTLARATTLYLQGSAAEALDLLGARPSGAAATYLRALCLQRQGRLLPAAAAFQETAERYPQSRLRDHALLAKANTFLSAGDPRGAAGEFARMAERVGDPAVRAEAELRAAGAVFMTGRLDSALVLLRGVAQRHPDSDVAARAQFLVGEVLVAQDHAAEAIVEYNRVLTAHFQHSVAASAQYRVARCLDRLGRHAEATGAYQAVVSGYPLAPEAPAAAYLAGVGLLAQDRPPLAARDFQLVLDRYAPRGDGAAPLTFNTPEVQELVEAALCMLEYSYHRAGDLGQLAGAPHVLLTRMPPGHSLWRAWALIIDADALAAQGRYAEAQKSIEQIMRDHPDRPVSRSAAKLLAWTYSRQGHDSLAIATEEKLLARASGPDAGPIVSAALLDIAGERFNQRRYREAAAAYEDFLRRFPVHPRRLAALYQAGLCYLRLDQAGDAVDRWEAIVRDSAQARVAERAWARMGDAYFQAARYDDARRCYRGLLENFATSPAGALASLRLAQCEYNAGHDEEALPLFAATTERWPGTPVAREARRGTELALYRLSQRPDGARVLARLLEQFPESPFAADAQFQIARRAFEEQRYEEAAEGFRGVVTGFPGYSAADQAQFLMADAYAHAGRKEDERQACEQFMAYFPNSELVTAVQFRLGLSWFQDADYTRAAVAFTRVLGDSATAEMRSASRYNLALCQRQLGDAAAARTELERYRQDFPDDARRADVAYQLGDLDEAEGRAAEARAEFERALASAPRPELEVEVAYRAGLAAEQQGEAEAALASYRRAAASRDAGNAFRLSALARSAALHERRHEYTRALAAYRDIAAHAQDQELVAAATEKVAQLEANTRRR